jgi:hypothetical protein
MKKWMWWTSLAMLAATPATAQQAKAVNLSIGYAIVHYLEAPHGYSPFGVFGSVGSTGQPLGFEVEGAYHHDTRWWSGAKVSLNTLTAGVGPRYVVDYGDTKLFLHALAGLHYDRYIGRSNSAFGGMLGGGVDFPFGSDVLFRLGGDVQIFFDDGGTLKTLRLIGGMVF